MGTFLKIEILFERGRLIQAAFRLGPNEARVQSFRWSHVEIVTTNSKFEHFQFGTVKETHIWTALESKFCRATSEFSAIAERWSGRTPAESALQCHF